MSYLHGVEIIQKDAIAQFRAGNTSIIGVVGVAATGDTELTLITNITDAKAKYGDDLAGTTIISALKSLFKDGNAPVIVVNVAESADQAAFIVNGEVDVAVTGEFVTEVYEAQLGVIANPVPNLSSKLIAGIEKLKLAESKYGYRPNFIICPGYSQVLAIGAKMRSVAGKLKGKAIIDLYATSVSAALSERTGNYSYSDERVILCSPNVKVYNEDAATEVVVGLSQLHAAEIISGHAENGFWTSVSNRELKEVTGSVYPVIGSLTDSGADNQLLNAQGIVTIFRTQGSGIRLWGNWTSAFPTSADLSGMIAPSIVKDVIEETIKRESLRFMDKNISYATLDYIVQSVKGFFYVLKAKGALIDADITYLQEKNPVGQIAQGQFVFSYSYCPYPSLDRLSYESYQDIKYLNSLFQ